MKEKVIETIKKYNLIKNGDKIVIGVSGGPDSITLLNVLLEIKKEKIIDFDIVVCHVNHMIREDAILDEEYVLRFCQEYNIEFFAKNTQSFFLSYVPTFPVYLISSSCIILNITFRTILRFRHTNRLTTLKW